MRLAALTHKMRKMRIKARQRRVRALVGLSWTHVGANKNPILVATPGVDTSGSIVPNARKSALAWNRCKLTLLYQMLAADSGSCNSRR